MRYALLKSWLQKKVDYFNSSISSPADKLKEVSTTFSLGVLPAPLKEKSYIVKLAAIRNMDDVEEGTDKRLFVAIQFLFLLSNRPIENYVAVVDTYLSKLLEIIEGSDVAGLGYVDDTISTSIGLANLSNIMITAVNGTDNSGKYLLPTIEFTIDVVMRH